MMNKKDTLFPFRISRNMREALKQKLYRTCFKPSLAMRAAVAQILNMEREDMMNWIASGARMVDRMELETEDKIDTPAE